MFMLRKQCGPPENVQLRTRVAGAPKQASGGVLLDTIRLFRDQTRKQAIRH